MLTQNHVRHMVGCFVLLLTASVLGVEGSPDSSVSGYDCSRSVGTLKCEMPILVVTDSGYTANPFGCWREGIPRWSSENVGKRGEEVGAA